MGQQVKQLNKQRNNCTKQTNRRTGSSKTTQIELIDTAKQKTVESSDGNVEGKNTKQKQQEQRMREGAAAAAEGKRAEAVEEKKKNPKTIWKYKY